MAIFHFLLFLVVSWLLGNLVTAFIDPKSKLNQAEKLICSLASGFLILVFLSLAFAVLSGKLLLGVYLGIVISAVILICFRAKLPVFGFSGSIKNFFKHGLNFSNLAVALIFVIFLGVLFQILVWDANGFPQATLKGWGDIAYHLDMVGRIAHADPFVLDQPIANGEPLTYPVFINFFSGLLVRFGLPLSFAWYIPSLLFGTTMFFLLYFIGQRLIGSKRMAALFIFLVLVGGGLGLIWFFGDLGHAFQGSGVGGIWNTITDPPHEYTHLDSRTGGKSQGADSPLNIVWIAPVISFFTHQRSFVVGLSIMLLAVLGWLIYDQSTEPSERKIFMRWLPALGFLPLSHSHTLLSAAILFGALFIQKLFSDRANLKFWIAGALIALVIALPQLAHLSVAGFAGHGVGKEFFKPWLGWMTCTHSSSWFTCDSGVAGTDSSVFWFWTKNFGVIFWGWIFALAYFLFKKPENKILGLLMWPSIALFAIPNLFLLQPWEFDNNKVLLYWWALAIILFLAAINQALSKVSKKYLVVVLAVIVISGGLAGLVDSSFRIQQTYASLVGKNVKNHAGFYGDKEVEAAAWIIKNTKPNDGFLTADGANNFVPMLTGRPIFLGFSGWLWTQGRGQMATERQNIAKRLFESGDPAEICGHGVRWLMWEPPLFRNYPGAEFVSINKVGDIKFSQEISNGVRLIIQLNCI